MKKREVFTVDEKRLKEILSMLKTRLQTSFLSAGQGCRYWKEGGGNGNRARRRGDWEMPCIRSARAFPESPPDF